MTSANDTLDLTPIRVVDAKPHQVSQATREKAEEFKLRGNEYLTAFKFSLAIEMYSAAIALYPTAIYHSNRAAAHIQSENYGVAIKDADASIDLDPNYLKAYYRKGSAEVALGHHKQALKNFKIVVQKRPNDKDARAKYKACEKLIREAAFASAIQSERNSPLSETIDLNSMVVDNSYNGPALPENLDTLVESEAGKKFLIDLMNHFKHGKCLHRKYAIQILLRMKDMFMKLPTLLRLNLPPHAPSDAHFTVCGDTHGQFYDVCNIFELNGLPSNDNPYLFNGDFVDRGSFSLEVVMTYFAMKMVYPHGMHLLRGNHESKNMNKIYGFEGEVKHKYDDTVMQLFTEVFNWLPLAAVLGDQVLVVHGGLFNDDLVSLQDIENIARNCEPPESGLMSELMWSDPQPFPGRGPSKRGIGLSFGPDVTKNFLKHNNLELLVRSHEVKDEGYLVEHDGKCITVFSAPNYCDQMGNKGAFIRFNATWKPKFTQFQAVEHPPIRPMAYAGNLGGIMGF